MAYTTLKKGSSGNGVKKLQQALIDAGYDVGSTGADGIFGTNTEKAVKSYQKDNGLSVDGIAGNQTFGTLYATGESTSSGVKTNTGANYTVNPTSKNLNGVDQETTDRMNSSFLPSDKIGEIGEQRDEAWDIYKGYATDTEIIDPEIWEILNTPFVESDEYKQAMGYADNILEQLSTGRTQYTDQIIDMMDKIQNREDFEYDVDKDQLFQQALASAIGSGKSAMQDTIGQASSLTGGYGSTYATSAGNQAYNSFIEDAYNNLPEYYQMALDAYKMEGEEMYQQLGMLRDADATEYQRMYNSWDAYFKTGQQIWNQDHTKWQDKTTNAYNQANLQLEEHGQLTKNAYDMYTALNNQYEAQYAREYADWENMVTQAQTYAQLLNSDWWNQKNYDQSAAQHNAEMGYKYAALAEDKRQFNYSIGDTNNDGVVSTEEKAALTASSYKTPSQAQKEGALKAYNEGGEQGYLEYIDGLPSDVNVEEIDMYVVGDGKSNGYGVLPYSERTYTIVDAGGKNWLGGVDNNVVVKDQYDNEYKLSELKKYDKDLAKELSDGKKYPKGATYKKK